MGFGGGFGDDLLNRNAGYDGYPEGVALGNLIAPVSNCLFCETQVFCQPRLGDNGQNLAVSVLVCLLCHNDGLTSSRIIVNRRLTWPKIYGHNCVNDRLTNGEPMTHEPNALDAAASVAMTLAEYASYAIIFGSIAAGWFITP